MKKLFGTDGIRGIALEDLNIELASKVASLATKIIDDRENKIILIGRDTRISGQMLSLSLAAGAMAEGAKVIDLGIIPTPAISYLVKKYDASLGIMVTASHNPYEYNGIKIFNKEGLKLADEMEELIESKISEEYKIGNKSIGTYASTDKGLEDYVKHIIKTSKNIDKNLKIVVDCANGSASLSAPIIFKKLGLNVTFINKDYDGYNINKNAGSTHMENLIKKVKELKADIGIAYDGDADRCLLVDDSGNIIDGDNILSIIATEYKKNNKLTNNTLVGTVMSNLGLIKLCKENNINFVKTKVGDRYVLEEMLTNNYIIGGEQSGHIIFKKYANTGDGELTSIQILNIMSENNKSLKELSKIMKKYPQVLINVNIDNSKKYSFASNSNILNEIEQVEKLLGDNGRVLVRASGTEPLIRIMIEGENIKEITKYAKEIEKVINENI